jgi:DNA repair protein SbcC/Rad50
LNPLDFKKINVFYAEKPLYSCSFGQRCTAVLVALMTFGNKPLVVDEPEAHLDSRLIAEYLVDLVKKTKPQRQIIFATHNANFVINGDAELIHILKIDDLLTTTTPATIENLQYRSRLLGLEGGKEAFQKRERKLLRGGEV